MSKKSWSPPSWFPKTREEIENLERCSNFGLGRYGPYTSKERREALRKLLDEDVGAPPVLPSEQEEDPYPSAKRAKVDDTSSPSSAACASAAAHGQRKDYDLAGDGSSSASGAPGGAPAPAQQVLRKIGMHGGAASSSRVAQDQRGSPATGGPGGAHPAREPLQKKSSNLVAAALELAAAAQRYEGTVSTSPTLMSQLLKERRTVEDAKATLATEIAHFDAPKLSFPLEVVIRNAADDRYTHTYGFCNSDDGRPTISSMMKDMLADLKIQKNVAATSPLGIEEYLRRKDRLIYRPYLDKHPDVLLHTTLSLEGDESGAVFQCRGEPVRLFDIISPSAEDGEKRAGAIEWIANADGATLRARMVFCLRTNNSAGEE